MKSIWLLAALALTGCGKPNIDPAFQLYVDQWNQQYPDHKVDVDIQLSNLGGNIAGQWDGNQVTIDVTFWNQSRQDGRFQVLFHELGHAEFNYAHDPVCISVGNPSDSRDCLVSNASYGTYNYVPRSIMFPFAYGDDPFFATWKDYYLGQLGSCTTCTDFMNGDSSFRQEALPTGLKRID